MGGNETWVKLTLTKNQWANLKDMAVVMLWETAYTETAEKRAEKIIRHIDKKMLTNEDIEELLPILEDYVGTNRDEGRHSVAAMYKRLENKLENALKHDTKM